MRDWLLGSGGRGSEELRTTLLLDVDNGGTDFGHQAMAETLCFRVVVRDCLGEFCSRHFVEARIHPPLRAASFAKTSSAGIPRARPDRKSS